MDSGRSAVEQQQVLDHFLEITCHSLDARTATSLLASVGWNLDQALQLHLAAIDLEQQPLSSSDATQPLLEESRVVQPRSLLTGWLSLGLKWVSDALGFLRVLFGCCAVLDDTGGNLRESLIASYGQVPPQFSEGTFQEAVAAATRRNRLLVVYLHSGYSEHTESFVTQVLCHELVRTMLEENFVVWAGDISNFETHEVSEVIHAQQYPCLCILLPAQGDIRVVGAVHGEVKFDETVGLLSACIEEMDGHRTELAVREAQQQEDRYLREFQDREYEETLLRDMERENLQRLAEESAQQEACRAEEARCEEEENRLAQQREEEENMQERRRKKADALQAAKSENATSRLCLRLRSGARIERKFHPTDKLADVYAWADCASFLPENDGRKLDIPARFVLKTSFPSTELTSMDSTVAELELAGTIILLIEAEED
uniref:UBX domain-containing protein n=1 Tax=Noctiluca scintillans TaxID=2966 RepID=A0A7S0ZX47_NOCSC|mmetsp:Transcript_2274/g.6542  ORF Transcript_2274/g.6542 Transcript_2274/m.6542 type:complete len:431 (+) Transcript_2274:34-1326(+)